MQGRLESLMAGAAEAVGAHQIVLLTADAGTGGLHPLAHWGSGQPVESYVPLARWVLDRGGAVALHGQELADSPLTLDPQMAVIAAPVLAQGSHPGVLVALLPETPPDLLTTRLDRLRFLSEMAAGLLEAASLQEALRHKEKHLRTLVRSAVEAQETERQRIAMEVHDGITQTLTSAFHHLQALAELTQDSAHTRRLANRATALVRQSIQECRAVIHNLQPPTLHPQGLAATLRQEVRLMKSDARWKISLDADQVDLPIDVQTNLYRIVQEALANASKHAEPSHIWIRLKRLEDLLILEVKDRGRGFDPQALDAKPGRKGMGLLNMRKRAGLLGGTCTVESHPQRGTTVRVEIPLPISEETTKTGPTH